MEQRPYCQLALWTVYGKKLTDNVFVQPDQTNPGFYLHNEIARIVHIWMTKFSDGHSWQRNHYSWICGDVTITESINWHIYNDVTNEPASEHAGGNLGNVAWPFNEMAKYITGHDYAKPFTHTYDNPSLCPVGIEDYTSWAGLHLEWNLYYVSHVTDYQSGLHLAADDQNHYKKVINNMSTVFPIAAVSGMVDHTNLTNLTKYENGDINPYGVWELAYCQFNNVNSNWTKTDFEEVLDLAPMCTNPANAHYNNQLSYWIKDNVAIHGLRPLSHDLWGYYSGLDYMLMYNLYRLQFSPNSNQEGGYSERSCECPESEVNEFNLDGGEVLIWPPHSVNISSPLTALHTVPAIFPEYKTYKHNNNYLKLYSFLVTDLIVGNAGQLKIQTDFKISNQAELTIANGGIVSFADPSDLPKTVYITDGSHIKIANNGILEFAKNSIVIFQAGSYLDIEEGGLLRLLDNAKVIIERGAYLECGNGTVNLSDASSVLEIRGTIRVKDNETFKTIGNGYLLFNSTIVGQAIPFNIIGGNNSSVSFTRTTGNKPKVLEVASGTYIYPDGNLNLFEMKNITVELGTEAYLNLGCPIKLEYCMFKKIPSLEGDYVHGGIKLYGQKDYQNPALGALINHCYFFNAKFGIRSFHNYGNRSVRLLRNNFRFCETGVYTFWHGLYLNSNTFTFCKTSVEAAGLTGNALFEFNQVVGSFEGMRFSGTSSSSVIGGANTFLKSNGVFFTNSEATLMCNKFQQGAWHIGSFDNFKLNLNSSVNPILMPNSEVYGGYNHFDEQFEAIYNAGNGVYDINWGYNVFRNTHYPSSGNSLVTQISNRNTLPTDNSFSENCWIPKNHLPYIPYPPVTDLLAFNQSRHFSLNFTLGYLPYMTGPEILYEHVPQCPVNLWRTQLHSEFDPTEPSNQALMAIVSDNVLGNLPLENPTVTVGGGVYMGVSLINATMDGINAAHSGVEDGRAIINTTGLGNLCDLLSNVNQNMNWQDILSIKRHYMVYLANALETEAIEYGSYQHSNFLTSSIYMIDHILTVNNTVNTDTDVRNKNYFQLMMDKTDLYNLFGEYTSALGTLGQINITLGEDEQHLKAAAYCQTSNLKNLKDSAITLLEFTDYITACSTFLDAYYHFFIEEYPVLFDSSDYANLGADSIFVYTPQEPEPEPSGLMLVISPNPADNYLDLAINLYQPGNIEIRVYDKFGILKHLDDLGYKTEDMHPYQINTMSYISDVYYLHVILDGTPYSDIFLVNH